MAGIKITGDQELIQRLKRLEDAVNASTMEKVAQQGMNIIQERTESGEFLNGRNFKYSTKGAVYSMTGHPELKKHYRSKLKGANRGGKRKDDSTARFVFLERGYMQFRELKRKQVAFVNLMFTGGMLGGMFASSTDNAGLIGFRDARDRKIAYFLSIAGAGKNKKIYEFFGFSEQEKDRLFQTFEQQINSVLEANGVS